HLSSCLLKCPASSVLSEVLISQCVCVCLYCVKMYNSTDVNGGCSAERLNLAIALPKIPARCTKCRAIRIPMVLEVCNCRTGFTAALKEQVHFCVKYYLSRFMSLVNWTVCVP
uniref:Uncharacterized protein n=1 Tax=Anopheles quadriannulatus TaxID=34691 RepID=A0A182XTR5_ANOQN